MSGRMKKPKIIKEAEPADAHVCAIYSRKFGCGLLHEETADVKVYVDLEDPRESYKDMKNRQAHLGFWSPDGFQFDQYDQGVKDHVDAYFTFTQLLALRDRINEILEFWNGGAGLADHLPSRSENPAGVIE